MHYITKDTGYTTIDQILVALVMSQTEKKLFTEKESYSCQWLLRRISCDRHAQGFFFLDRPEIEPVTLSMVLLNIRAFTASVTWALLTPGSQYF